MTKKDYEKIAKVFRTRLEQLARSSLAPHAHVNAVRDVNLMAFAFARMLAEDNARFKRATFLAACGVEEEDED